MAIPTEEELKKQQTQIQPLASTELAALAAFAPTTVTQPTPTTSTPPTSTLSGEQLATLTPAQKTSYDALIKQGVTPEAAFGNVFTPPPPTTAQVPAGGAAPPTAPVGTSMLSQEQLNKIYGLAADIGAKGGEYASSDVNSIVLRATGQSLYDLSKVSPELADSIIASLSPIALGKREEGVTNIENQRAETERKQFEERMRADQESRQRQQEATRAEEGIRQMQERASMVSGLARTGSLYTTTAGGFQPGGEIDIEGPGSIVGDLKRRNEYELSMYRMKLEDESRKFNEAMQDGNAALANVHSQNLRGIESDFYNRRQQQVKDELDARNKILDINKGLKAEAQDEMATFIRAGNESQITPGYLEGIEKQIAAPRGWGQAYFDVTKKQVALEQFVEGIEQQEAEVKLERAKAELLNATPLGHPVTIGDKVYYGLDKKANTIEDVEIDKVTGEGFYWSFNRDTKEVSKTPLGQIGTPGEGLKFGFNKGQPYVYNPTTDTFKWIERPAVLNGDVGRKGKELKPLPITPSERQWLLDAYMTAGYTEEEAETSINDLTATRPRATFAELQKLDPPSRAQVNQIKDDLKNFRYTRAQAAELFPELAPYF